MRLDEMTKLMRSIAKHSLGSTEADWEASLFGRKVSGWQGLLQTSQVMSVWLPFTVAPTRDMRGVSNPGILGIPTNDLQFRGCE